MPAPQSQSQSQSHAQSSTGTTTTTDGDADTAADSDATVSAASARSAARGASLRARLRGALAVTAIGVPLGTLFIAAMYAAGVFATTIEQGLAMGVLCFIAVVFIQLGIIVIRP